MIPTGRIYTGREMAANLRDGQISAVETFANLDTHNARGEKQGEAVATRVELSEATLGGRLGKLRFNIERVRSDGTAIVEIRA